jgi:multiple sugar transport system ATP-binding protein
MAEIRIENLKKSFGALSIIKGVSLTVPDGDFCVFVGPSGCGKSTLLRLIAGLETPNSGKIFIDDQEVTALEPYDRQLSMVFQSYALYPHMSVWENIAFSLRTGKISQAEIDAKVDKAARILRLEGYLDRKPMALSGGQRQRVAIGRAIVREPKAFLFDEPLSNLDAALRTDTRVEIATLHSSLSATMIYVTHDQVEAMTLANRIVVLCEGQIMQVGTPRELYQRPANVFVAQFLGSPKMNVLPAAIIEGNLAFQGSGLRLAAPPGWNGLASVGLRAEDCRITSPEAGGLIGTVALCEYHGSSQQLVVDLGEVGRISAFASADHKLKVGEPVGIVFYLEKLHPFDSSGARLVC